jgi:hypothetical protein
MEKRELSLINTEITKQIANVEVQKALLETTFKGLTLPVMKQAMLEGMMRGFKFEDFLEKNIYAIPFSGKYSLVTSIDYSRKVAMRSGIVGKEAPVFTEDDKGNVVTCSITVKRKINDYIGDFTATVYFKEYTTGRNLWTTKPRTMIAKVAEMHALRMACPEELAQSYIEEEMTKEVKKEVVIDLTEYKTKLEEAKTLDELKKVWSSLPIQAKQALTETRDQMKVFFEADAKENAKATEELPAEDITA